MIKFKEWKEFDIRCGEIKEIKEKSILVDINSENLIVCDKGKLEYNKRDKVIIFLEDLKVGRILAACKDNKVVLLKPEKDIDIGSRVE